MYFLEQIKRQVHLSIIQYLEGPDAGINQVREEASEKQKKVEGPKKPDEVLSHAQETNEKLQKDVSKQTEVARELGVENSYGNDELRGQKGDDTLEVNNQGGENVDSSGEATVELAGEGSDKIEVSNTEILEGLSEKPPFNTLSPEERDEMLAQIEKTGLEVPEGMTREKALQEAMTGIITEKQDDSISKIGENIDESIITELTEKYGEEGKDRLAAVGDIYQELIKNGAKIPENIEDFEKMITEEIARREIAELQKEDPEADIDPAVVLEAARSVYLDASAGHLGGYNGETGGRGRNINFEPGNGTENAAQLNEAIQKAPNETAKKFLQSAQRYLGMNETDNKSQLQSLMGFDPAKTPWCKGCVNAWAKEAGIPLASSGSLYSRAAVSDGVKVNVPQQKPAPGDLIIVERAGSAGGAPAGHIGVFLAMSPNGNPIIIGGNQGGSSMKGGGVTISEERRPIVSVNNVSGPREQNNRAMS